MENIVKELVEALKYQREKMTAVKNVCDNCLAHMIHEEVDRKRIGTAIEAGERYLAEIETK